MLGLEALPAVPAPIPLCNLAKNQWSQMFPLPLEEREVWSSSLSCGLHGRLTGAHVGSGYR